MPKSDPNNNSENTNNLKRYKYQERTESFVKVSTDLLYRGTYLTPAAKWLYVVLRSFKNENHTRAFPGYKAIMERSGLSRNAVAKGLAELERWGWITRYKAKGSGNSYVFSYPSLINVDTKTEVGDQTYPTKELALDWAKHRRKNQNNNSFVDDKKKPQKTKKT
jgi:hypothetical protein